jgi:hypothetical protein
MVRGVNKALSKAIVTLSGPTAFEMDVDVKEGSRHYRGGEKGQLLSECQKE